MGGRPQRAGVCRRCEEIGETIEGAATSSAKKWPRHERSAQGVGEIDRLLAAAFEDDAIWGMDGEGFSDRVGASGGSSTLLSGRTLRLRGDALDPREGGSLVAFALHR